MDRAKGKDLKTLFDQTFERLALLAEEFPWENKKAYALWLAQTYYFVRHTTVFLTLTAARFGVRNEDAHKGTLRHLREETGHDKMAMHDLKGLGYSIEEIPEMMQTSMLYQTQYYWIDCFGPVSHAGYALMLEGIAAKQGPRILERVEAAHGKGVGSFLRVHVHADDDHFDAGIERLSQVPASELEGVKGNLIESCELYHQMMRAIMAECAASANKSNVVPLKKAA